MLCVLYSCMIMFPRFIHISTKNIDRIAQGLMRSKYVPFEDKLVDLWLHRHQRLIVYTST